MPSPFPGMDPYIEMQIWDEFHNAFIQDLADELVPNVRPGYVVRRERRVYVESDHDDPDRYIIPDAMLLERPTRTLYRPDGTVFDLDDGEESDTLVEVTLPMAVTHRESYLTVRDVQTLEIVTVLELLSPASKRKGSDGWTKYLDKRNEIFESYTSLVEIDLLRGGTRMPTVEPLPPGDYYALVCRGKRRPRAEVHAWPLAAKLPTIPIPLAGDDDDVMLDLQRVFNGRFDRSGYDYTLQYDVEPKPAFSGAQSEWVQGVLRERQPL